MQHKREFSKMSFRHASKVVCVSKKFKTILKFTNQDLSRSKGRDLCVNHTGELGNFISF